MAKICFHDFVLTTAQTNTSLAKKRLFLPLIRQAWKRRQVLVRLLGIGDWGLEAGAVEFGVGVNANL